MSFLSSLFGSSKNSKLESYVAGIANDSKILEQASNAGLVVQTISWEDSGRFKNSCWGPNISDMTLRLSESNNFKQISGQCLPMIRYGNFSDRTCDTPMKNFSITVGNETVSSTLKRIPLQEYLQNIGDYVKTSSGKPVNSLFCAQKDSNILTSVQYCILPLGSGTTDFNVNLYNYQSSSFNPAVLVLVCSQKGTSAQAIFGGTTQLFFNNAGEACNYVAERLKDERKRLSKTIEGKMDADESERNALFIFQIPLKVKERPWTFINESSSIKQSLKYQDEGIECMCDIQLQSKSLPLKVARGMDNAMISVSKSHSKFEGVKDFDIERDTKFPIRCTIQLYKCTDEASISNEVWIEMKDKIDGIYTRGLAVGSLVTDLKTDRTTEWNGATPYAKEFAKTISSQKIYDKPLMTDFFETSDSSSSSSSSN